MHNYLVANICKKKRNQSFNFFLKESSKRKRKKKVKKKKKTKEASKGLQATKSHQSHRVSYYRRAQKEASRASMSTPISCSELQKSQSKEMAALPLVSSSFIQFSFSHTDLHTPTMTHYSTSSLILPAPGIHAASYIS